MDIKVTQTNIIKRILSKLTGIRELGLAIGFILLCTAFSFASPYFLVPLNIFNVLRQVSLIAIIGIGKCLY